MNTEDIYVGDGSTTTFGITFPFLEPSHVYVTVNGVPTTPDYVAPSTVGLTTPPAAGAIVRVYRETPNSYMYHEFQLGAPFLPAYIDKNNKQLLYSLQEYGTVQENVDETLNRAVRAPSGEVLQELPGRLDRKNRVLTFNSNGQPEARVFSAESAIGLALALADDSDPDLGASLVGMDGSKVRDQIEAARGQPLARRSLVTNLGFRDEHYDYVLNLYGYDFLYAQSFAVDPEAGEVFVLKGQTTGDNSWGWVWVHDLNTGAVKSVFTLGEQWRESLVLRTINGRRWLYTIGSANSIVRADVTTLPTFYSTSPVERFTPTVPPQSFLGWDGASWWVQDYRVRRGRARRNLFVLYDEDFSSIRGEVALPDSGFGTLSPTATKTMHKGQGIAIHAGAVYSALGGAYDPNNPTTVAERDLPYYAQGLYKISSTGELLDTAVAHPVGHLQGMAKVTGHANTVAETEGLCSAGGTLYGLWVTLGPKDRVDPANAGLGYAITRELDASAEATDFTPYLRPSQQQVDWGWFQGTNHHSAQVLLHPVTGQPLDSVGAVTDMMLQYDLSRYAFSGTGQTLVGFGGQPLGIAGRLVEFQNVNGFTVLLTITGAGVLDEKYVLQLNAAGVITGQLGPYFGSTEVGSGGSGNGFYIRHACGSLECYHTLRVTSSGYLGSNWYTGQSAWTFPLAFINPPTVMATPVTNSSYVVVAAVDAVTTNSANIIRQRGLESSSSSGNVHVYAIGRWK